MDAERKTEMRKWASKKYRTAAVFLKETAKSHDVTDPKVLKIVQAAADDMVMYAAVIELLKEV